MLAKQLVFSVSDLVGEMQQLMERSYPEIWIEGELSSLSKPASGHLYFSLKDETSQLRCAMFRSRAVLSRYKPKTGDLVRVRAKISIYQARGDLQCIVQHIEAKGEGVLQRRFEELKTALSEEGLFAHNHKLCLPTHPRHIGLITSPTGAAIRDVLSTLKRRNPGIPVTVYPAVVQGDDAAKSLTSAIELAQQHGCCDALIMARGGGSLEDLWCFNSESLARAIFSCQLPIISGVGHEVDVTIADLVADLRAPTPTAAAELLSPERDKLLHTLRLSARRMQNGFFRQLHQRAQTVDLWLSKLNHPSESLRRQKQAIQLLGQRLMRSKAYSQNQQTTGLQTTGYRLQALRPSKRLALNRETLRRQAEDLVRAHANLDRQRIQKLQHIGAQLHIVSPLATLGRGFAIARDDREQILRDSKSVKPGESITVELKHGVLSCEVSKTEPGLADRYKN